MPIDATKKIKWKYIFFNEDFTVVCLLSNMIHQDEKWYIIPYYKYIKERSVIKDGRVRKGTNTIIPYSTLAEKVLKEKHVRRKGV